MEYERIHKVQTGIISPSKLRMKLIGPQHQKKKKDGSNSNSSRTSPSKLEDSEFVKNSLLAAHSGDFDQEVSRAGITGAGQGDSSSRQSNGEALHNKTTQPLSKADTVRTHEDENLDYDSTSSFEFHREKLHHHTSRSFSKPIPSKWNDAEKWIVNRHNMLPSYSKKMHFQQSHNANQQNRALANNMVRVAPESASYESKLLVKRVDFCQPASQLDTDPYSIQENGVNVSIELEPECRELMEVESKSSTCTKSPTENTTGVPNVRSVSMRDMGTEMTPIPSQEPSRTTTPLGSTPLRSPTSSIPSTPRWEEPAPTPCALQAVEYVTGNGRKEMSELELKLKTRKEIVALGVKLGKINIAAWASKDDKSPCGGGGTSSNLNEVEQIEFAKRAAAWEEAEKTKHNARFKREEIKIQAWESQQKAKLEAEMRRIEAQVEEMRAQGHANMVKQIALARQRAEEKRAVSEATRNRKAEKVAAQVEYIRHSGRLPTSFLTCCGWS